MTTSEPAKCPHNPMDIFAWLIIGDMKEIGSRFHSGVRCEYPLIHAVMANMNPLGGNAGESYRFCFHKCRNSDNARHSGMSLVPEGALAFGVSVRHDQTF